MTDAIKSRNCGSVPWHLPDWRWRRACSIVSERRYATIKRDGNLIRRTVHYIRAISRARTDRGTRNAAKKFPAIYLALKVVNEPTLRPLEIKARTLAGQSDQAIARHVGLPESAVTTYINLFLDIRDRLEARTWISRIVIGLPLDRGPSAETLMLLHAWYRGPSVIEPWLDFLPHQGEHHDLTTTIGRQRASLRALLDAQQLPNNAEIRHSLWKKSLWTLVISPETARTQTVSGALLRNSMQMHEEIAWETADEEGVCAGDAPISCRHAAARRQSAQSRRAG